MAVGLPSTGLDDDCLAYRDAVVAFAQELDRSLSPPGAKEAFTRDVWKRCAEVGLTGLTIDPQHGGQGADAVTAAAAMEAFGYGCRDNGLIFSVNAHLWSAATPIDRFGTEEQKQRYLVGLCDGSLIGVQGMTEPESGSDAMGMSTTAREADGGWVLDGSKTYITNAPVADVFVVFATVDPALGWAGVTAFVVERDAPGLEVGAPFQKMGIESSPMSELRFDGCRLPADALLGRRGAGMALFNHSMEWERGFILASAVGVMQRHVENAVAYARERKQFGSPIGKFQAVSHRIADMRIRLEAARALLYRMASIKAAGGSIAMESSIVKVFLSEAWVESSLDHLQVHGALGFMREAGIEQDVRDALASRIYSGTSDIQRNLVARHLKL